MAQLFHLTGNVLVNSSGTPYLSAKAWFYETGTTTPKTTYSDAGLTAANANPVVADGTTGIFPDIYLSAGRYKVLLLTSADVTIDTWDPVDATVELISATAAPANAFAFMEYHNTTDGFRYRRNSANSAWISLGPVDTSVNAACTVTEQLTGTETAKASTPDTVAALWQRGTDIASAATLSLPATGGGVFNITGTTNVSGISSAQGGREIELQMAGAVKFAYNAASMILPGAKDYITHAGEILTFRNDAAADANGSNWRCYKIVPAATPVNTSTILTKTANYTIVAADKGKLISWTISSAATATLPAANAVTNGARFLIANDNTSTTVTGLTIARAGADTIDNSLTSRVIYPGQRVALVSDGTSKWYTENGQYQFISSNQTITLAGTLTIAHGLGSVPSIVQIEYVCTTGENAYTAGDIVSDQAVSSNSASDNATISIVKDATNLTVRYNSIGYTILNKTTGASAALTVGNWAARFTAVE